MVKDDVRPHQPGRAVFAPVEASFDAPTAVSARCDVWLEALDSVVAVDFIDTALSSKVCSNVDISRRNATMAASTASRRWFKPAARTSSADGWCRDCWTERADDRPRRVGGRRSRRP